MSVEAEFLRLARHELRNGGEKVFDCLSRLSGAQIWHRDHGTENSVGNLVLHLAGNVRQWIVSGLGGEPDRRDRDQEFAAREQLTAAELRERLSGALDEADAVLVALPRASLAETRRIQIYDVTVLHAVLHVVVHFSGHVGQIIWITKHVTGEDLGHYAYLKDGSGGDSTRMP